MNGKRGWLINRKKGEITTQQLVTIIILIASFVIILFLLYRLDLGKTTNADVCHNSVVLQAQSKITAGSLDCTTDYLCVSGGDKCTSISQTSTANIDTSKSIDSIKNQTFLAIANEMANCWWEFGEGKIDYATAETSYFTQVACSVCSITAFDNKVQKKLGEGITYKEFYNYLRTTPKTQSQTYLQYIYGTNTLAGMENLTKTKNYLDNTFNFSKTYFILTGVAQGGYLSSVNGLYHAIPFTGNTKYSPQLVTMLEKTQDNYNVVGCNTFLTKS